MTYGSPRPEIVTYTNINNNNNRFDNYNNSPININSNSNSPNKGNLDYNKGETVQYSKTKKASDQRFL